MSGKRLSSFYDENTNPCIEEGKLTTKCLERNWYENAKCVHYFENYKTCKLFWAKIKRQRIASGIFPALPTKAERDRIKELRKEGIHVYSAEEK